MKRISLTVFKSQCLAVIDEVQRSGKPVVITKTHRPIAKLIAIKDADNDLFGYMAGKARIVGDVINSGAW